MSVAERIDLNERYGVKCPLLLRDLLDMNDCTEENCSPLVRQRFNLDFVLPPYQYAHRKIPQNGMSGGEKVIHEFLCRRGMALMFERPICMLDPRGPEEPMRLFFAHPDFTQVNLLKVMELYGMEGWDKKKGMSKSEKDYWKKAEAYAYNNVPCVGIRKDMLLDQSALDELLRKEFPNKTWA